MSVLKKLKYLLPSHRRALERDMKEEFESVSSMSERRELGNLTLASEGARAVWGWEALGNIWRDLQYAVRTMRHSPGFTATAVLSLALGIGANTSIFSLIDALMLRRLPVPNPQELVMLTLKAPGDARGGESFSYAIVTALARERELFSGVTGFGGTGFNVGPRGAVQRVLGMWVAGDYYGTLGLTPAAGRLLTRDDDTPGAPAVAVISDGYWERAYARRPDVVGQTILLNGVPATIVGVSPPGFVGANVGAVGDITITIAAIPQIFPPLASILGPGNYFLRAMARPLEGVSVAQATAGLNARWPAIAEQTTSPGWPAKRRQEVMQSRFELSPGGTGWSYLRTMFRKPLLVLMVVVALVLLIACANVANLLLARATTRQREISVRLSIGAGRGRLIRQLLTESLLLSSMGAALGIELASLTSRILVQTQSMGGTNGGGASVVLDLSLNWHVLGFTAAVAMATGILFGLVPAFQTTAAGPLAGLKDDGRRTRSRALGSLVSVQVALSLLLLVGAGLFVRTLQNMANTDMGFRQEGVLLVDVAGEQEGYSGDRLGAFNRELLDRVRGVPGVASASISGNTPLSGGTWTEAVAAQGQPLPDHDSAMFIASSPGYFTTLGTPVKLGREFVDSDEIGPSVAIVDETFAARNFAGQNPVGQFITARLGGAPSNLQVIGVVKNTVTQGVRRKPYPTVYLSYFQKRMTREGPKFAPGGATIEVRARGSMSKVAAAVLRELQPKLPGTPLEVRAMTDQVARTLVQEHLMARLAGGFGGLGLLLACVGLYGLLSYGVARRIKEIGVRLALGAQRAEVQWMVVRGALRPVIAGVLVGVPATWAASRWIQTMLFGLTPTDPAILTIAVTILAGCGIVVAYFPARRAARVDPMIALRHE